MATCDFCGTTSESDEIPLTWTTATEHDRFKVYCDRCSRDNLRAMEGKLDSEFW